MREACRDIKVNAVNIREINMPNTAVSSPATQQNSEEVSNMSSQTDAQADAKPQSKYKRVLLKMSGEVLMDQREFGIDPNMIDRIAKDIKQAVEMGVRFVLSLAQEIYFAAYPAPKTAWSASQQII